MVVMEEKKKIVEVVEKTIKAVESNGYDWEMSPPPSTVISGINIDTVTIRIGLSRDKVERAQKEKRENAIRGDKIIKAVSKGGKEKAKGISGRYIDYQSMADKIWKAKPTLSKSSVAIIIFNELKNNNKPSLQPQTIRKKIKKNIPQ